MTKKDFILIANTISELRNFTDLGPGDIDVIAARFALALRAANPRFDRDRFIKACRTTEHA